jgi:hypothetical protein
VIRYPAIGDNGCPRAFGTKTRKGLSMLSASKGG